MNAVRGAARPYQPDVWIVRHGETEWSRSGKHTSFTDLELTAEGERAGQALAERLGAERFDRVLTSPMSRARRTSELAGFADRAVVDARLVEWQYGAYEGITTAEIRKSIPGFTVWTHPIVDGEQLDEASARADLVVADLRSGPGRILVFGHGHFLRIVTARWLGLPAIAGANLALHTATVSVLGWERETPTLQRWNA
jgi:probable phosphoglycerate mutase